MLVKSRDGEARSEADYSIVEALPDSVLSDRALVPRRPAKTATPTRKRKASAGALPDMLQPQLATLADSPPDGDWRYEVKFDGYRMLARIDGDDVRLFTRNGHDWSAKLPHQVEALKALGLDSAWLDGEMVVADESGVADFQALQAAFDSEHDDDITYYLFDLPYLGGKRPA